MTWIKLDDCFPENPKVIQVGFTAGFLWIAGIAYCSRHKTDGFIPRLAVDRLVSLEQNGERLAAALVDVHLWIEQPDGYQINDYLEWQRSAVEIETASKQAKRAGKQGGLAKAKRAAVANAKRSAVADAKHPPLADRQRSSLAEADTDTDLTPPTPPSGGTQVRYNKKIVPKRSVELAERVLAEFNKQTGGRYKPYTGAGKLTGDLRVIIGFLVDFPDKSFRFCSTLIAVALKHPWWDHDEPVSPGMIFSPKVAQKNMARLQGQNSSTAADRVARLDKVMREQRRGR